jgi:hypothetical protein
MKKTNYSKVLFQKLGIKQTADLLGRKMEISFFHKLDASWYFVKLCFLVQSCSFEIDFGKYVSIVFPWVSLSDKEYVRLIITPEGYLIHYKSPITADKPVDHEIQEFYKEQPKGNTLSRGKYRLL